MEKLREFLAVAFGFVRQTKESYDTGTRFMRLRVWILGLLAVDVVATVFFVVFSGSRPLDVEVWFERQFPSNMLVVVNAEGPLSDATLVLDKTYRLAVERIDPGPNGYEVNRAFRDSQDISPPDTYRPKELVIWLGGARYDFEVGDKKVAP